MNRVNRAWVLGGLVAGTALLLGCTSEFRGPELAAFQLGEGACATGLGSVLVSVEPGALSFTGRYLAPTPCHALHPVLIISGQRDLTLVIESRASESVCIQCLGRIPYTGRIEGLSGRWRLRIFHGEDLVWDAWHEVLPP